MNFRHLLSCDTIVAREKIPLNNNVNTSAANSKIGKGNERPFVRIALFRSPIMYFHAFRKLA